MACIKVGISNRLQRWKNMLAESDYEIVHIPGTENKGADIMSRIHQVAEKKDFEIRDQRIQKIHEDPLHLRSISAVRNTQKRQQSKSNRKRTN